MSPLWTPLRARLRAHAPARVHACARPREARGEALGGLWRRLFTFLHAIKRPGASGREDMMKKGKGTLSAGLMMEAWQEDGRTIGRLRLANAWLAERLAELGIRPGEDVEAEPMDAGDVAELARAWMQAAEVDASLTMEQGRTRA